MLTLMLACSAPPESAGHLASPKLETGDPNPVETVDPTPYWPLESGRWTYTGPEEQQLVLSVERLSEGLVTTRLRREDGLVAAWVMESHGETWELSALLLEDGALAQPRYIYWLFHTEDVDRTNSQQHTSYLNTWESCAAGTCLRRELTGKGELEHLSSSWLLAEDSPPLEIVIEEATWSLSL